MSGCSGWISQGLNRRILHMQKTKNVYSNYLLCRYLIREQQGDDTLRFNDVSTLCSIVLHRLYSQSNWKHPSRQYLNFKDSNTSHPLSAESYLQQLQRENNTYLARYINTSGVVVKVCTTPCVKQPTPNCNTREKQISNSSHESRQSSWQTRIQTEKSKQGGSDI